MIHNLIAIGHYDHRDQLWITRLDCTSSPFNTVKDAIAEDHRIVTNDDDDYLALGVLLEDNDFAVLAV